MEVILKGSLVIQWCVWRRRIDVGVFCCIDVLVGACVGPYYGTCYPLIEEYCEGTFYHNVTCEELGHVRGPPPVLSEGNENPGYILKLF